MNVVVLSWFSRGRLIQTVCLRLEYSPNIVCMDDFLDETIEYGASL